MSPDRQSMGGLMTLYDQSLDRWAVASVTLLSVPSYTASRG